MPKRKASLYPPPVQDLIAEKSAVLSKAQAFSELGMEDMAQTLWEAAAGHEERLAPLLESLGHDLEARRPSDERGGLLSSCTKLAGRC